MDHVVVDVEIQQAIEDTPGGWDATDKLGVAVACLWEYQTARMRVYGPEDVPELRKRLLRADRITGYNIFNFDFPVIWGIGKADWLNWRTAGDKPEIRKNVGGINIKAELATKTDDMLRRIWKSLHLNPDVFSKAHGGWKLDNVAAETLSHRKIGFGGDAPKWYQDGLIQKVCNYCADDVALERDLCDFIERYGYVVNDSVVTKIPLWGGSA